MRENIKKQLNVLEQRIENCKKNERPFLKIQADLGRLKTQVENNLNAANSDDAKFHILEELVVINRLRSETVYGNEKYKTDRHKDIIKYGEQALAFAKLNPQLNLNLKTILLNLAESYHCLFSLNKKENLISINDAYKYAMQLLPLIEDAKEKRSWLLKIININEQRKEYIIHNKSDKQAYVKCTVELYEKLLDLPKDNSQDLLITPEITCKHTEAYFQLCQLYDISAEGKITSDQINFYKKTIELADEALPIVMKRGYKLKLLDNNTEVTKELIPQDTIGLKIKTNAFGAVDTFYHQSGGEISENTIFPAKENIDSLMFLYDSVEGAQRKKQNPSRNNDLIDEIVQSCNYPPHMREEQKCDWLIKLIKVHDTLGKFYEKNKNALWNKKNHLNKSLEYNQKVLELVDKASGQIPHIKKYKHTIFINLVNIQEALSQIYRDNEGSIAERSNLFHLENAIDYAKKALSLKLYGKKTADEKLCVKLINLLPALVEAHQAKKGQKQEIDILSLYKEFSEYSERVLAFVDAGKKFELLLNLMESNNKFGHFYDAQKEKKRAWDQTALNKKSIKYGEEALKIANENQKTEATFKLIQAYSKYINMPKIQQTTQAEVLNYCQNVLNYGKEIIGQLKGEQKDQLVAHLKNAQGIFQKLYQTINLDFVRTVEKATGNKSKQRRRSKSDGDASVLNYNLFKFKPKNNNQNVIPPQTNANSGMEHRK